MRKFVDFLRRNKHIFALKIAIAAALLVNHFWPSNEAQTIINLVWLFLF